MVSPGELDPFIEKLTGDLLAGGPEAHGKIKQLIRSIVGRPLDDALVAQTAKNIAEVRVSPEGKEGIASFLEKRKPAWVKNGRPNGGGTGRG
jgi:methylglutaconyl-CoA hydratase